MTARPKYAGIAQELIRRIKSGAYAPGSRLPGHVKVAREFGVSPMTANRALKELAKSGLIERSERLGSFVAEKTRALRKVSIVMDLESSEDESRQDGHMKGCVRRINELDLIHNIYDIDVVKQRPTDWHSVNLGEGIAHIGVMDSGMSALLNSLDRTVVVVGAVDPLAEYCVAEDRKSCARELVQAMINDGHKKIGFVGNLKATNHRLCRDGYVEGASSLGIGYRYVRDADSDTIEPVLLELLSEDIGVDAVVVAGGHLPIAALPIIMSASSSVSFGCFSELSPIRQLQSIAYLGSLSVQDVGPMAIDLLSEILSGQVTEPTTRYAPYSVLNPRHPR